MKRAETEARKIMRTLGKMPRKKKKLWKKAIKKFIDLEITVGNWDTYDTLGFYNFRLK